MPPNDQSRPTPTEFLAPLAANGQFERLARYVVGDDARPVRREAADLLATHVAGLDPDTADSLRDSLVRAVLTDSDDTVRAHAVEALLALDDSAVDSLVAAIEADSEPTPTESPHPLLLVEWLDSDHATLRLLAVAGLGSHATPRVVPKLAAACSDADERVRRRAIRECGRVGDARAVESVVACLDDESTAIRRAAVGALIEIGTDDALQAVFAAATPEDPPLRYAAVAEIGTVGSLDVFGFLLHALDAERKDIRRAAVASTVELVVTAPPEASHVARETVSKQLAVRSESVVPRLIALAGDADRPQIRRNAVWLLDQLLDSEPSRAVIDCFVAALADSDEQTGKLAASALVRLDDHRIIDRLEAFIMASDVDSAALARADFVRDRLTDTDVEDQRKAAVEFTTVSDPADYTRQKHGDNA